jgi:hypothetical protein
LEAVGKHGSQLLVASRNFVSTKGLGLKDTWFRFKVIPATTARSGL